MPATTPFVIAAVGALVGLLLQLRLRTLGYRMPDEISLPRPASWWVVPVTAVASGLVWWAVSPGHPWLVPAVYVLAVWVMVALAWVDLDVHRLPDRIQLPAAPALVVLLAGCSLATDTWSPFVRALVAGVVLFVVYLVLALLPGGGIGFGDVKLAGLLGMLLGWLSWAQVWWATLATFLIGGVVAVALLALRRKGAGDEFAYGPAMLLGAVGALVAPAVIALVAR